MITWKKANDPKLPKRGGWTWYEGWDGTRNFFAIKPDCLDPSSETHSVIQSYMEASYASLVGRG